MSLKFNKEELEKRKELQQAYSNNQKGDFGEDCVCDWLSSHGFIIDRNIKTVRSGDIDVLAWHKDNEETLYWIEVKNLHDRYVLCYDWVKSRNIERFANPRAIGIIDSYMKGYKFKHIKRLIITSVVRCFSVKVGNIHDTYQIDTIHTKQQHLNQESDTVVWNKTLKSYFFPSEIDSVIDERLININSNYMSYGNDIWLSKIDYYNDYRDLNSLIKVT